MKFYFYINITVFCKSKFIFSDFLQKECDKLAQKYPVRNKKTRIGKFYQRVLQPLSFDFYNLKL